MSRSGKLGSAFCLHWGERTLSDAVRKALQAFAPTAMSTIPIDVEAVAKYVGIEQVLKIGMAEQDGLLSRTPSGTYIVTVSEQQGHTRRRFTVAHEIGHVLVHRSIRSTALVAAETFQCRASTAEEREEERLCDLVAAELLMPREHFIRYMEETGVCASTLPHIARYFDVSLEASARRATQLVPYDFGVGVWSVSADGDLVVPRWYVTRKGARQLEHAIKAGTTGSECFTASPLRGWHWIPIQGHMDKYFVDVFPLHGEARMWLVFVIYGNAAQQIMDIMSKSKPARSDGQLSLGDI